MRVDPQNKFEKIQTTDNNKGAMKLGPRPSARAGGPGGCSSRVAIRLKTHPSVGATQNWISHSHGSNKKPNISPGDGLAAEF